MRFSLFQFLLFITSVCLLCTLFARAPMMRGIVRRGRGLADRRMQVWLPVVFSAVVFTLGVLRLGKSPD